MLKNKMIVLTSIIGLLMIFNELMPIYVQSHEYNFSIFIRGILNNIYNEEKKIIISKLLTVLGMYLIFFYVFSNIFSVNIDGFRRIIKFNSSNVLNFYKNTIVYFGKLFLHNSIIFLMGTVIVYAILTRDFVYANYVDGILDLLKLPILLFFVVVAAIIYPAKRIAIFTMIYLTILTYIVFFNYSSYIYVTCAVITISVLCVIRLILNKDL